jgi:type I restriction enzyme S subunit
MEASFAKKISKGWNIKKIKQIANVVSGSTPDTSNSDFWNGQIIWLTPDDLSTPRKYTDSSRRKISRLGLRNSSVKTIKPNSIVMSSRAPIGYLSIVIVPFTTNQGCKSLELYKDNPEYVYYFLHTVIEKIKNLGHGTTFQEITKSQLQEIDLILPDSLEEQRIIATILSTIDESIDQTDRLIQKYQRIKQGLMQDLFRYGIDEQGNLRNEKTHRFKNSPLGRIPEEWDCPLLGEIYSNLRTGSTPSRIRPDYFTGDILWVTSGELKYRVILDTKEKITCEALKNTNLKLYPPGTFFIAITGLEAEGTRGSCAIIGKNATTNQSCMAFTEIPKVHTWFLYQYYRYFGDFLSISYSQGTKQQSLNSGIVKSIPIKLPKKKEQIKIAELLNDMDSIIIIYQNEQSKLRHIKAGLMADLLSGNMPVNHLIPMEA